MVKTSEYPDDGELVFGTVTKVKNFGAFVSLDEYAEKEGFIHIGEVAPGYVRYIRDFVKEGQKIVCKVLGVKPDKGHIDLSLKQVNEHQRREKIQEWKNEKRAEKLFEIVAEESGMDVNTAYNEFGYRVIDTFDTMYGAFEECALDPEILAKEGFEGDWVRSFKKIAVDNIIPPKVYIKGLLQLTCPGPNGIDYIIETLQKAEKVDTENIKVYYVGAPRYRIEVEAFDYKTAEALLKKAVDKSIKHLRSKGGEADFVREEA